MNNLQTLSVGNFCGLYEITQTGEILYSRIRKNSALINLQPVNVGKNLFNEVLMFDNSEAFCRCVKDFWNGVESTQTFVFDSRSSKKSLPLRVSLIRVRQTDFKNAEKFIIVDIRKFDSALSAWKAA